MTVGPLEETTTAKIHINAGMKTLIYHPVLKGRILKSWRLKMSYRFLIEAFSKWYPNNTISASQKLVLNAAIQ